MNSSKKLKTVIVYIDQAFGTLRKIGGREGDEVLGIDLMPSVMESIEYFKENNMQLIVQFPGDLKEDSIQVLSQYLPWVDQMVTGNQDLIKSQHGKNSRAMNSPNNSIVIAADRSKRRLAANLGYTVYPHVALAAMAMKTREIQFARMIGDREQFERIPDLIPYYIEEREKGDWYMLAVVSDQTIVEVAWRGLKLDTLPLNLAYEDPMIVQIDDKDERFKEHLTGQKVLAIEDQRMLISIGAEESDFSMVFHGQHGHLHFLFPNPGLMIPATTSEIDYHNTLLALNRFPLAKIEIGKIPDKIDISDIIFKKCPVTASSFQEDVDCYSGVSNIDSSGSIQSRHIQHPDNERVVGALLDDLQSMGYCAYTHEFSFAGMTLKNVIADLPGRGYWRIDPDITAHVRDILIKYRLPDPPDPWINPILQLLGKNWIVDEQLENSSPLELRMAIEKFVELKSWYPWWLPLCQISLAGPQLVIVGCHLDSTAANDASYDPLADPAPGADDDASGIAGTLAIARYLADYRNKLIHTVRFCFFNAEEFGLIGSKAYAAMLKGANAPIKSVVCMDMMGYNSDAARIFEIHAGYYDPVVRDTSVPIADRIAYWAASLNQLNPAQIYKGTSAIGGPDRNTYDGAINRSDHAAFHQQGYPAVVVSEDFFINLASEPGADPNPNYHRGADTAIDSAYAADITCAVAFAVKEIAQSF